LNKIAWAASRTKDSAYSAIYSGICDFHITPPLGPPHKWRDENDIHGWIFMRQFTIEMVLRISILVIKNVMIHQLFLIVKCIV
jgi:hypothetical protein